MVLNRVLCALGVGVTVMVGAAAVIPRAGHRFNFLCELSCVIASVRARNHSIYGVFPYRIFGVCTLFGTAYSVHA